jgi:hypothetical protein
MNQTTVVFSSSVSSRHFHCVLGGWHKDPRRGDANSWTWRCTVVGKNKARRVTDGRGGEVRGARDGVATLIGAFTGHTSLSKDGGKIYYRWNVLTRRKNTDCTAALEARKVIWDSVAPQFPADMGLPLRKASLFSPAWGRIQITRGYINQ